MHLNKLETLRVIAMPLSGTSFPHSAFYSDPIPALAMASGGEAYVENFDVGLLCSRRSFHLHVKLHTRRSPLGEGRWSEWWEEVELACWLLSSLVIIIVPAVCMEQKPLKELKQALQDEAERTWDIARDTLFSDGWHLDQTTDEGFFIHSKKTGRSKTILKISTPIKASLELLYDRFLVSSMEDTLSWNDTLKDFKVLYKLDEREECGIFYQVTQEGAAGFIASRDFVNLSLVKKYGDDFVMSSYKSISLDLFPPVKGIVRYVLKQNMVAVRSHYEALQVSSS
ncbi:unnamed protein product [Darwinula stevensoni]|uniref:START domain-containing protein n=1 Tax=Darwinula stevensoni TaxID=69355 RepID=A0A7R8XEG3_9CRUS|nr:unnamed protein product [Darwinula stevensoni]CAG0894411.1 unnamed protein product [Darwinula stevensoni]